MPYKLSLTATCAFAIAVIAATQMPTAWVSAQPEAAVQKPQLADRTPPEIKEGVKIYFAGAKAGAVAISEGKSATVVRVQGNWVYLKREQPLVDDDLRVREAWVNFDTVGWYRIEKN